MGIEKIKTIVLSFMIALSLLLSTKLMFGVTGSYNSQSIGFEEISFGRAPSLINILLPWQSVIITEEENILVTPGTSDFSKVLYILEETLPSVQDGYQWQRHNLTEDIFSGSGMYLNFGLNNIPDYLRFVLPNVQEYTYQIQNIHGLYYDLEKQRLIFLDFQEEIYWTHSFVYPNSILRGLIEDVMESSSPRLKLLGADLTMGFVFVPKEGLKVAPLVVSDEDIESEKIRKSFFSDMISRKIQERDGTIIYTDGISSGLRIFGDNVYEYTAYQEINTPSVVTVETSFRESIQFITNHGGWPSPVFLYSYKSIDPVYSEHQFGFSYYGQGLPVLSTKPPLEVTIKGGKVLSYFRNINKVRGLNREESKEVINAKEIIGKHVKEENKINRMFLSYYVSDVKVESLYPVWVLDMGSRIMYVNAYTGDIVREE